MSPRLLVLTMLPIVLLLGVAPCMAASADTAGAQWSMQPGTVAVIGFAVLLVYSIVAWWLFGRSPAPGSIYPRTAPPDDLSPAAVRLLFRKGVDRTSMAATILQLAHKGWLTIQEPTPGEFTLKETEGAGVTMTEDERALRAALFAIEPSIIARPHAYSRFFKGLRAMGDRLAAQHHGVTLTPNLTLRRIGLGITILAMVGITAAAEDWVTTGASAFVLSFCLPCLYTAARRLRFSWRTGNRSALWQYGWMTTILACVVGVAAWLFLLAAGGVAAAALLCMGGLLLWNHWALRCYTPQGRALMDAIQGYRLFLATTAGPEQELVPQAPMTAEGFAAHLPYAMALDAHGAWAQRLQQALSSQAVENAAPPNWYQGAPSLQGAPREGTLLHFATTFPQAFRTAIVDAAMPPKGSILSDGGGYSVPAQGGVFWGGDFGGGGDCGGGE